MLSEVKKASVLTWDWVIGSSWTLAKGSEVEMVQLESVERWRASC